MINQNIDITGNPIVVFAQIARELANQNGLEIDDSFYSLAELADYCEGEVDA